MAVTAKGLPGSHYCPLAVVDGGSGVPYPSLPIAPWEGLRDVAVTIVKPHATLPLTLQGQ